MVALVLVVREECAWTALAEPRGDSETAGARADDEDVVDWGVHHGVFNEMEG